MRRTVYHIVGVIFGFMSLYIINIKKHIVYSKKNDEQGSNYNSNYRVVRETNVAEGGEEYVESSTISVDLLQNYYCVDSMKSNERANTYGATINSNHHKTNNNNNNNIQLDQSTSPYRCTKNPLDLRIQIDYPKEYHDYIIHQLRIQESLEKKEMKKKKNKKKMKNKKNKNNLEKNQYYYDEIGYYNGYNMGIEQRIDGTEIEKKEIRNVIDSMNRYWFEEVLSKPTYERVRKTW